MKIEITDSGAKAALSTGIDSYTMITRHNGKEFRMEVYDYKADPIVPKFNMETGLENPHVIIQEKDGTNYKVYYLETKESNSTEIILQAKRHNREKFVQAVKSQLLYFDNVDFVIYHEDGREESVKVTADIQYQNEHFILSDNDQFSKPHILINNVNYGYVNWEELELEDKTGNIAYKLEPDSVDIKPSRESLIWSDKTRRALLDAQINVNHAANLMVQSELQDDDLLGWAFKCSDLLSGGSKSIVGKLSSHVDKSELKPKYTPEPRILWTSDPEKFFGGMEVILVTLGTRNTKDRGTIDIVKRERVHFWGNLKSLPIYVQEDKTINKLEKHLLASKGSFVKIKLRSLLHFQEAEDLNEDELKLFRRLQTDPEAREKWEELQNKFFELLKSSKYYNRYEDVEYPKTIKDGKEVDEDEEDDVVKQMSEAEKRKNNGQTVLAYPNYIYGSATWYKDEPEISKVLNDEGEIIYGFKEDEEVIKFLGSIIPLKDGSYSHYNKDLKLVRVSMQAAKLYRNHTYIKDAFVFIDPKTKTISMHTNLVKWHTGRKIQLAVNRMKFLENFSIFNEEIAADYQFLMDYMYENYRESPSAYQNMASDMNELADKIIELQVFIDGHPGNTQAIAAQSKTLFEQDSDEETFVAAAGIDIEVYKRLQKVLEYISPLETLFNHIAPLLDNDLNISPELEVEIKAIMKMKGVL